MALAFSQTGMSFLAMYMSGFHHKIEIRSSRSGTLLKGPFIFHSGNGNSIGPFILAFSANESHIVYIHDGIGIIMDAGTGQTMKTFKQHKRDYGMLSDPEETALEISPNSKYILMKWEEKVGVWDIDAGEAVHGKWLNVSAYRAVFSNSSEKFATMHETGEINFWDINSGNSSAMPTFYWKLPLSFYHEPSQLGSQGISVFVSNEKYLVIIRNNGTGIEVWSLETHQHMSQLQSNSRDLRMSSINHSESESFDGAINNQILSSLDDPERTKYALVAWKKALFSESSYITFDGWVLGPNKELLFWVPEERCAGLWRPKMVLLTGVPITKLSFDNFVHGSRWIECKESL